MRLAASPTKHMGRTSYMPGSMESECGWVIGNEGGELKVTLKVDIEVNPRWFRSAVSLAGVPGRGDEAKAELERLVSEQVAFELNMSKKIDQGTWERIRVHNQTPKRRVLRSK